MKIYYVDAENVGIDFLEGEKASVLDKVFVFSNSDSLKSDCEKLLYTCVSGYPSGKNQADFHMIAHLTRLLSMLSKKEKGSVSFIFCSKDQDLLKAFDSQCSLAGIKAFSSYPGNKNKIKSNGGSQKNNKRPNLENLILESLVQPSKAIDIQRMLGVSKSEFSKAINKLIKTEEIKRHSKSSKKWRRV